MEIGRDDGGTPEKKYRDKGKLGPSVCVRLPLSVAVCRFCLLLYFRSFTVAAINLNANELSQLDR